MAASGIIMQNTEVRQARSLSFLAFGNPDTTSIEVKREATDQGMWIFLSVKSIFHAFITIRQNQ